MNTKLVYLETQILQLKKKLDNLTEEKYRTEGAIGVLEELKSLGVEKFDINDMGDGTRHYHHTFKTDEDTKIQE